MTARLFSSRQGLRCLAVAAIGLAIACGRSETPEETESAPAPMPTELTLSAEQIAHAGVKWAPATTATATETLELPGELKVDEDRTARV